MGRSFANLAPNKESHPIHPTQELPGSALRVVDGIMVVRVRVRDAATAGGYALEPALVERLEEREQRAGPLNLLRIDQLLAAAELTRRDVVLHIGDDHRDHSERRGDAGDLGDHAGLHDLRLDLVEAGLQAALARSL